MSERRWSRNSSRSSGTVGAVGRSRSSPRSRSVVRPRASVTASDFVVGGEAAADDAAVDAADELEHGAAVRERALPEVRDPALPDVDRFASRAPCEDRGVMGVIPPVAAPPAVSAVRGLSVWSVGAYALRRRMRRRARGGRHRGGVRLARLGAVRGRCGGGLPSASCRGTRRSARREPAGGRLGVGGRRGGDLLAKRVENRPGKVWADDRREPVGGGHGAASFSQRDNSSPRGVTRTVPLPFTRSRRPRSRKPPSPNTIRYAVARSQLHQTRSP